VQIELPLDPPEPVFRPLRICFAVPEFGKFHPNAGIGTAYEAFAEALAKEGHDITVLISLPPYSATDKISPDEVAQEYARRGIHTVPLPEMPFLCTAAADDILISYRAWHWLQDRHFDVIHFTDWKTAGFFCVTAKQCGLGFHDTHLCFSPRSPSLWCREGNGHPPAQIGDLVSDFLEKRTAELADTVFIPSRHIAEWMENKGWKIRGNTVFQRNLLRLPVENVPPASESNGPFDEIVFFGRLEPRKGLDIFCKAISLLNPEMLSGKRITFLGRHTNFPIPGSNFDSKTFILENTALWPVEARILPDHTRAQALSQLARKGVLAVLPARLETACNAVLECLALKIPFLAAATSGVPELIPTSEHSRVLFSPTPEALAAKLTETLTQSFTAANFSFDPEENERRWIAWHREIGTVSPQSPASRPAPKVSVCMTHYNQPELLRMAIASLEEQTYENFEVILLDDGSTHPDSGPILNELAPRFEERKWKLIRQENRGVSAARNAAVQHATGEYLMFMDDDNVAKPHEIETFVAAALSSGARLLVCPMDCFKTMGPAPLEHNKVTHRHIFCGGPLSAALFRNVLGDTNCFIERQLFQELGGFSELDYPAGEDVHLLAKALFQGGEIMVLPDSLYWYRIRPSSRFRSGPWQSHEHVLALYQQQVSPELRDTLAFSQQLYREFQTPNDGDFKCLTAYRTVSGDSYKSLGLHCIFNKGWHADELNLRWMGADGTEASLLILSPAPDLRIDFSAHVHPLNPENSLAVQLNKTPILPLFSGEKMEIKNILLQKGLNSLTFQSALPPAPPNDADNRPLSHAFSEIDIGPARPLVENEVPAVKKTGPAGLFSRIFKSKRG
jgi:glycosyltransferase involved in cell wall biosynthesis